MSRIGRKVIDIPAGVTVTPASSNVLTVTGPKGTLTSAFNPDITIRIEGAQIFVERSSDDGKHRALHGLTRALLANMVKGVTEGFSKQLEVVGIGYRAQLQGGEIVLDIGFSHQVVIPAVAGITYEVPNANTIVVSGADKQLVGQVAANIRGKKPPEPYHGKGIRYSTEHVRHKEGKAGKK